MSQVLADSEGYDQNIGNSFNLSISLIFSFSTSVVEYPEEKLYKSKV